MWYRDREMRQSVVMQKTMWLASTYIFICVPMNYVSGRPIIDTVTRKYPS